jgi:predicted lipoprotein with Yx(FWY)xxD motif
MRRRIRPLVLAPVVVATALALAACSGGSSSKDAGSKTSTSKTSTSKHGSKSTTTTYSGVAPTGAGADVVTAVSVAEIPKLGKVLVGENGNTLYTYTGDHGSTTSCTGSCASTWPLVGAKGAARGGAGVLADKLTTADRHALYSGHLLHTYSGDEFPGDVKGLQVSGWHAISPDGTTVS